MAPSLQASLDTKIAVLEERVANAEKAKALQGLEYERRLSDLNHAHAQAQAKNAEYLPRDVYQKSEEGRVNWQRKVDDVIVTLQARRDTYSGFLALGLSLLSLVLTFLLYINS